MILSGVLYSRGEKKIKNGLHNISCIIGSFGVIDINKVFFGPTAKII